MAKPQIIQKVENLESSIQSHTTQLADITKTSTNVQSEINLADIFNRAWNRFIPNFNFASDLEKPRRMYTIQFEAVASTNKLVLPIYSGLNTASNYDNDTFKTDRAYVSQVLKVYDLTADPGKTMNLYSNFRITGKQITLNISKDATSRVWEVVCEAVPYQGIGERIYASDLWNGSTSPNTVFRPIYDPECAYATTDGYNNTTGNFYLSPIIARCPLHGTGDADTFDCTDLKIRASDGGTPFLKQQVLGTLYSGTFKPFDNIFNIIGNANYRGVQINYGIYYSLSYLEAGNKNVNIYPMLVKAIRRYANPTHDALVKDGEILLMVMTSNLGSKHSYVRSGAQVEHAVDFFRIEGRPVCKGEVFVV